MKSLKNHSFNRSLLLAFGIWACVLSTQSKPLIPFPRAAADTTDQRPSIIKPSKILLGTGSLEHLQLGIGWQLSTHQQLFFNGALHFANDTEAGFGMLSVEHRYMFGTQLPNLQRRFYWYNRAGLALPFDQTYGVNTGIGLNFGKSPRHSFSFDLGLVGVVFGGYEPFGFAFPAFRFQTNFHTK